MKQKKQVVYFIQVGDLIKIGRTSDYNSRIQALKSTIPNEVIELGVVVGGSELEKELHKRFNANRSHGEWFHATSELISYVDKTAIAYEEGVGMSEQSQKAVYGGLTIQQMHLMSVLFEPRPRSIYQRQVKWTVLGALTLLLEIYESGELFEETYAGILDVITRKSELPLLDLENIEEFSLAIATGLIGFSRVPRKCPPKDTFNS